MVLTIGPAVRGAEGRRLLFVHSIGLFGGATIMALITTLTAVGLASAVAGARAVVVPVAAGIVALWAVRVALGLGLPFPSSSWQVPAYWRSVLPPQITMLAYGVLLGVGFLTAVVVPVYWCFLTASTLSQSIILNLIAWWIYAGARASSTWLGAYRRYVPVEGQMMPAPVTPPHWRLARAVSVASLIGVVLWLIS